MSKSYADRKKCVTWNSNRFDFKVLREVGVKVRDGGVAGNMGWRYSIMAWDKHNISR